MITPEEFRELRNRLGWSVKQCAAELGLKPGTIYHYEEGVRRPKLATVRLMKMMEQRRNARNHG
jgi:transcriptional regulator with XRE-family HTH domain